MDSIAPVPEPISDDALRALMEPARFREAEARVAEIAPQLQHILASVLREGGYFDQAHEAEVDRIAGTADEEDRRRELRVLLAEETRLGMMVGVAVGLELGRELGAGEAGGQGARRAPTQSEGGHGCPPS
jgi:hypothetical protein